MTLGRLPPVYSPIALAALARGIGALAGGPAARRAETEIGEWLLRDFAPRRWLLVDSGTSALRLALQHAMHGRKPRRIALPAYGCYDLATACDGADAEVVLYDVDPGTLGPDWVSYEAALAAGPAAVVLVHLYGVPVDLERAMALAHRHGVRVIEDAAQGAGGSWQGRALGSFGDYAVLSFGRGKGITGGGGGALLLHSEAALDPAIPALPAGTGGARRLLLALAQRELSRPWIYWLPASLPFLGLGDTIYQPAHDPAGMTPASLGLLAGNLAATVSEAESRRNAGARYTALLGAPGSIRIPRVPDAGVAGYLRFPVVTQADTVAA
ncbi:MAG: DegT/DnrJ/EryC1/StrS family aminotransferase, partial [Gemmatimonadales bacterium]